MISPSLALHAKQHLVLTPRLQQSVRLLQLSSLEFAQELRDALVSNPFLESDDEQGEDSEPVSALDAAAEPGVPLHEASAEGEAASGASSDDVADDAQADEGTDLDTPHGALSSDGSSGHDPAEWIRAEPSLKERLYETLSLYSLNERDETVARLLIEALDDNGYLTQGFDEIAPQASLTPPITEEECRVVLKLIQRFDRPGIGARSLAECLFLQLDAMPAETPGHRVATELVLHHLDRLARRELAELQKRLRCNSDELAVACRLIRKLDPKPGEFYGHSESQYIVPDVMVRQHKGQWAVSINPAVLPRARIHRLYAEMFAQSGANGHSLLAQQLQDARWLIRNAHQRFTTIQRVAQCIVSHQKAFFDYGEIALRPLVLRDIADELNLHESTVSRATGNKYMATPRGIFEFKHFFPRELGTDSGGTCSSAAVRALLREMIDAETPGAPLSDVTLTRLLAEQGVQVARRTVAKYRHLMKVPAAEMRRQG